MNEQNAEKNYLIFKVICYWRHHIMANWKSCVPSYFIQGENVSPSEYKFILVYQLAEEIADRNTLDNVVDMIKSNLIDNVISIETTDILPDLERSEAGTDRDFHWVDKLKIFMERPTKIENILNQNMQVLAEYKRIRPSNLMNVIDSFIFLHEFTKNESQSIYKDGTIIFPCAEKSLSRFVFEKHKFKRNSSTFHRHLKQLANKGLIKLKMENKGNFALDGRKSNTSIWSISQLSLPTLIDSLSPKAGELLSKNSFKRALTAYGKDHAESNYIFKGTSIDNPEEIRIIEYLENCIKKDGFFIQRDILSRFNKKEYYNVLLAFSELHNLSAQSLSSIMSSPDFPPQYSDFDSRCRIYTTENVDDLTSHCDNEILETEIIQMPVESEIELEGLFEEVSVEYDYSLYEHEEVEDDLNKLFDDTDSTKQDNNAFDLSTMSEEDLESEIRALYQIPDLWDELD